MLDILFAGGDDPLCTESCNGNGDGSLDIADAIYILNYLFMNGSPPPTSPFPDCGALPPGSMLDCVEYDACP